MFVAVGLEEAVVVLLGVALAVTGDDEFCLIRINIIICQVGVPMQPFKLIFREKNILVIYPI